MLHNEYSLKQFDCREIAPHVPSLSVEEIIRLMSLGCVELMKRTIINIRKFWVKMSSFYLFLNHCFTSIGV